MHPKLSVTKVSSNPSTYKLDKANLNVVFKPGVFGGQLMAAALTSAIMDTEEAAAAASKATPGNMQVQSSMSTFLGPTLVDRDVFFVVSTVRKSGSTFVTKRVTSHQDEELGSDAAPNFESTVSFYKPHDGDEGEATGDTSYAFSNPPLATPLSSIAASSFSLSEVLGRIQSGEDPTRGSLYGMALGLAASKSKKDTLMEIRIPKEQIGDSGSGRSAYWVGLPKTMFSGLTDENLSRVIIPYMCDGLTQPIACVDPLDKLGWNKWPSKITVWNYGLWFTATRPESYATTRNADVSAADPTAFNSKDEKEGMKWFLIDYEILSNEWGKGLGRVNAWDWSNDRRHVASGNFTYLCRK
jgi:hypothetical protein